jgi:vancomycin resistance protein YoaR
VERLANAVAKKPTVSRVKVALAKTPPTLTAERLKGVNGRLATFATTASGSPKRLHNIRLAARAIDGTLLSPGEVFSINKTVGERTQARGYRTAPVFQEREKVPGIGGGVSQVTGTLFNAAALAGLSIKEVHPHSRPVAYLPPGRDATLAWQAKDLRFANNTQAPVFIEYVVRGSRLVVNVYGRKTPGRRVALRPVVRRLGPGKVDAQLYRVVKQNGKLVAKERLFTHAYRWKPEKA